MSLGEETYHKDSYGFPLLAWTFCLVEPRTRGSNQCAFCIEVQLLIAERVT
jgi:hypothetical protein